MKELIKTDEVKEIDVEYYEQAKREKKEQKAFEVLGQEHCEDLGLENNPLIVLLVNEEIPYYESYESTGCVSFLFKYQDKFYKYLYQW